MTEYVILRNDPREDGAQSNRWFEVGPTVKASSAKRALSAAEISAGEYVALPARSWKPLTVKVEQTTKVTIG